MGSLAVTSRSFSKHPVLRQEVLKIYPDAKFNDEGLSLSGKSLIDFLDGYEKAITALEKIDETILSCLPNLKIIGKYGVGLDMIDLHAMKRFGVNLGWTGGVNKRSVSELVISFSIYLLHRVAFLNTEVKHGKWYQIKGRELSNCTFGIIGCGHIGKEIIRLLKPFKCNILVYETQNFEQFYEENNVTPVGLEELIRKSDVVSLHLPLNNSTKNIINQERLSMLKKDSIFINLARGGLVDEVALEKLLLANKIAGAALDVFEIEPPNSNKFALMDNVLVTPHIGSSTEETIIEMGMAALNGLKNAKDPLKFL
jgi:phosphoglycerate dehydrogenase-like enzyme